MQAAQTGAQSLNSLVRGYGLGLLALEVSQGFLLEMSFHKDQICSHSSIIPK